LINRDKSLSTPHKYINNDQIIDRISPFGAFYDEQELLYTVRVLYQGHENVRKREAYYSFDENLKVHRIVNKFLLSNGLDWEPEDVDINFRSKNLDFNAEMQEVGLREGSTFFIIYKRENIKIILFSLICSVNSI